MRVRTAFPSTDAPRRSGWRRFLRRDLTHDTFWALVEKGGRSAAALGTFLIVTRALGVRDFGYFAGIMAFAGVLLPLASFGSGHYVLQRVSRDPRQLPEAWGDALLTGLIGTSASVIVVLLAAPVLIPGIAGWLVLLLAASELLFVAVGEVIGFAYRALNRFRTSAVVVTAYGAMRFATVLFLYTRYGRLSLATVATAVFGVSALYTVVTATMLTLAAPPRFDPARAVRSMRTSGNYMVSLFSSSVQGDIDKTMLVSARMPAAAGFYTAGARIVQHSLLPVMSLISASYPRFFVKGDAGGIDETWRYARQLAKPIVLYGLVTVPALLLLADVAADVVGDGYDEVASVIRAMAPLLVLQGLRTNMGNALTGANYQSYRTVLFMVAAAGNVAVNLVLIPLYSWRGAMMATYFTEAFLITSTLIVIARKRRHEAALA